MNARTESIDAAKVICRETGVHINSETATRILDVLESERKKQDRYTRHACAEAVLNCPDADYYSSGVTYKVDAEMACMSVKAV